MDTTESRAILGVPSTIIMEAAKKDQLVSEDHHSVAGASNGTTLG